MTDLDDALDATGGFSGTEPATNAGETRRKCTHPRKFRFREFVDLAGGATISNDVCTRCGHRFDPERQRRGRAVGKRGKAHERDGLRRLGITNVGGLNRERDGGDRLDPFVVQWKSYVPKRFPGWMLDEIGKLRQVGLMPSQTPILAVTEARQGVKRRGIVVVDLDDWIALHGPSGVADA